MRRALRRPDPVLLTILSLVAALPLAARGVSAQDSPGADDVYSSARHDFRVVTVAQGLDHPWSMAWLPSGEMLIVERPGRLRIVRDGALQPESVAGLPGVYKDEGQGGFMDVLPHLDFATNRLLYLSYGKPNQDGSQGSSGLRSFPWPLPPAPTTLCAACTSAARGVGEESVPGARAATHDPAPGEESGE